MGTIIGTQSQTKVFNDSRLLLWSCSVQKPAGSTKGNHPDRPLECVTGVSDCLSCTKVKINTRVQNQMNEG